MEYVYVFQSAAGTIKVGRTTSLAQRISTHLSSAQSWTHAGIDQIWTGAVADAAAAEKRILAVLHRLPHAVLRSGREHFTGVSFLEVVSIAADVCRSMPKKVRATDLLGDEPHNFIARVPRTFRDVVAIFDACDDEEIATADLLGRLVLHDPERYGGMHAVTLANDLRQMHVGPRPMRGGRARGYTRTAIYNAVLTLPA